MTYPAQYQNFSEDKQLFFSKAQTAEVVEQSAKAKSYGFLANNRLLIEQEFNHMFASLKKQDNNSREFKLYCYYCCTMLHQYYVAYDKKDQAESYRLQSEQILDWSGKDARREVNAASTSFRQKLGLTNATTVRQTLGFINMQRLVYLFSRITVKQSLLLAAELQWIEKLDRLIGLHMDIDGMVSIINAPAGLFNALSVGIFAARFVVNISMLLKHTFVPTKIEESISTKERFYQELYRRHYHLFNDLAWGSANLLCNYNVIVALSAPVASWLTSGFLVFDVCLLIVSHHFAEQEYLLKKEQYLNEKGNFDFLLEQGLLADEGRIKYDTHRTLLDEQLMQLELGWQKTNATDWFSVAAAAILLSGFTAAFLFTASAAVVVSFLICSIAIGMYLSASDYGQYQQKSFILQGNQDSKEALSEMQTARQDLMRAMFKNTIMPLFATTAFALCWPAALALTVMYFAYEPTRALFKGKPAKPSEIPSPPFSQADNDEAVVDVAHERSSAVCCH